MIKMDYLITGTGRCGTMFMANFFTSVGLPCSHESVFTPNGLGWARAVMEGKIPRENSRISEGKRCVAPHAGDPFVAESSYMAAPFLGKVDAKIVHVVRNPLGVVGSLLGQGFNRFSGSSPEDLEDGHISYERFMYDNVPELRREMPQLDRGCLYYVRWNEMIENSGKVSLFHRIEDGTRRLKEFVGFDGDHHYDNKGCNSVPFRRSWSLDEVRDPDIRKQIGDIAHRYGYEI